jgi:hypothetical protein
MGLWRVNSLCRDVVGNAFSAAKPQRECQPTAALVVRARPVARDERALRTNGDREPAEPQARVAVKWLEEWIKPTDLQKGGVAVRRSLQLRGPGCMCLAPS